MPPFLWSLLGLLLAPKRFCCLVARCGRGSVLIQVASPRPAPSKARTLAVVIRDPPVLAASIPILDTRGGAKKLGLPIRTCLVLLALGSSHGRHQIRADRNRALGTATAFLLSGQWRYTESMTRPRLIPTMPLTNAGQSAHLPLDYGVPRLRKEWVSPRLMDPHGCLCFRRRAQAPAAVRPAPLLDWETSTCPRPCCCEPGRLLVARSA